MEFTVKQSTKESIGRFVTWVKSRATDPVHEQNRDLIADFLEKVIVVELKRLENDKDERDIKIDIPDDQLPKRGPDPEVLIGRLISAVCKDLTDDDGNPLKPQDLLEEFEIPNEIVDDDYIPAKISRKRKGNNHKMGKKRPLEDSERDYITQKFIEKGGNLDDKDCSQIAKDLGLSAQGKTPWQVTGYVSELHRRVKDGRLKVPRLLPNNDGLQIDMDYNVDTITMREAILNDRKIATIKGIRAQLGWGLKEAKDLCDKYYTEWQTFLRNQVSAQTVQQQNQVAGPQFVPKPRRMS